MRSRVFRNGFFSLVWGLDSDIYLRQLLNWAIIGADDGLALDRRQAITWTKDDLSFGNTIHWNSNQNAFENVACKMSAILFKFPYANT